MSYAPIDVWHEMTVASVNGKNTYTVPVGDWVLTGADLSNLMVDTGSGFTTVPYGSGYTVKTRYSTPATVADLGIGFTYVGAVSAGWTFRFRWLERRLEIPATPLAAVYLVGGVPDYSVRWLTSSAGAVPNAVTVPEQPNMSVEFWRLIKPVPGKRGNGGIIEPLTRAGRRYVPYFRGAINTFTFELASFRPTSVSRNYRYKVCYVDVSNARSPMSDDTIFVFSARNERNTQGVAHVGQSVYIRRE